MATVPSLPGVVGQGETEGEALEDVKVAVEFTLESMMERGEELPPGDEVAREIELPLRKARTGFRFAPEAFYETTDPVTLAREQGVSAASFDDLLGDFWPEEEEPEEFTATLREWRHDLPHKA
ncbi:MAG: hypothetical protein M3122_09800 [Actinomycetota bacterium]|nr:hypothetical protein [Actinomycetota bacterium]